VVLVCWDLGLNRLPSCGVRWGEVANFGKCRCFNQVTSQGGMIEIVYRGV
jgi:hypothetical protein